MSQQEQNDWPSFEMVLRDLAPDSLTVRSLASADRRASQVENEAPEQQDAPASPSLSEEALSEEALSEEASSEEALSDETPSPEPSQSEADDSPTPATLATPTQETPGNQPASRVDDHLPGPLAPLELDTSSIRALIEPSGGPAPSLDDPALAELSPLPELSLEIQDETEDIKFGSSVAWESDAFATEDSQVFELDESTINEVDAAYASNEAQPSALDNPYIDAPGNDLFSSTDVPPLGDHSAEPLTPVVSVEDLEIDSLDGIDVPESAVFEDEPHEVFETAEITTIGSDIAPFTIDDDAPFSSDNTAFEIDEDVPFTIDPEEPFDGLHEPASTTDLPSPSIGDSIDLSNLTSELDQSQQDTQGDLGEPHTTGLFEVAEDENTIQLPHDTADFDSVATAEEIESHLDSLMSLDEEPAQLDNVIPLHRNAELDPAASIESDTPSESDPAGSVVNSEPAPLDTNWVSLPAEEPTEAPDPWAHMRPTEEPQKKGFWANRPKFFGGDDRKKAKAARQKPSPPPLLEDNVVGISYDNACPNCAAECKVDLDDPIGRRVHLSCPSCDHMWHTPYVEESQAG